MALNYRGVTYHFVANYYGGNGRDLVLLWTNGEGLTSATALNKLGNQLVLAVKQSRGDPPFDRATTLRPEVYQYRGCLLVEIKGSLSKALSDRIATSAGRSSGIGEARRISGPGYPSGSWRVWPAPQTSSR